MAACLQKILFSLNKGSLFPVRILLNPLGVIFMLIAKSVLEACASPGGELSFTGELEFEGKIVNAVEAQAPFVNNRQLPGTLELKTKPANDPGNPKDVAKVPGDGEHPAKLIATLVDKDGNPVVGAKVTFLDEDDNEVDAATTDEDGKAEVPYQPVKVADTDERIYLFTATTTAKSHSGVPYEESNEVTVIATPAALFGILRDNTTGEVIPNAELTITNKKTGEPVTIRTDGSGAYYHPVKRDEEYTITYNKMVNIGGELKSIPFTQKAVIEKSDSTTEGNLVPAEITAVGIVLLEQPNRQTAQFEKVLTDKMRIYLKDASGGYITDSSGQPKAFPMQDGGVFSAEGLSAQVYTMEVRYEVEPGKELPIKTATLDVKANGELNISQELVDPYGIVTDKNTGEIIVGAEVMLYYADTPRNRGKGITPGDKVNLPTIPGFPPHDNKSPGQTSDVNGEYAYMVYDETDYYLVVTKSGYERYTSITISVDGAIVRYDVQMTPVSTSEGGGGWAGGGSYTPQAPSAPKISANDTRNILVGMDTSMEYSVDGGSWRTYDPDNLPDLSGNHTVRVRLKAQGGTPAGEATTLRFTDKGTAGNELDDVPKTGAERTPLSVYLALALMSLTVLGICLPNRRKQSSI